MRPDGLRGRLLAVEGIDGAGKTTLAGRVAALCRSRGVPTTVVARYFAPELTALWGRLVDADAVDQDDAATIAACDYAVGAERTLRPALADGRLVIADRYVYSHLVHFRLRGVEPRRLEELFRGALVPDLVLHLVLPPSAAYERLRAAAKPDLWEAALDHRLGLRIGEALRAFRSGEVAAEEVERSFLAHQDRAAALFRELLPADRTVELDGRRPVEELDARCAAELDRLLEVRHAARAT